MCPRTQKDTRGRRIWRVEKDPRHAGHRIPPDRGPKAPAGQWASHLWSEARPPGQQVQSPSSTPTTRSLALGKRFAPRKHDPSRYLLGPVPHILRTAVGSPEPVCVPTAVAHRPRAGPRHGRSRRARLPRGAQRPPRAGDRGAEARGRGRTAAPPQRPAGGGARPLRSEPGALNK